MSKQNSAANFGLLFLVLAAASLASAQDLDQQQVPAQGDQQQVLNSLNLAGQQAKGLLMPMVNVDRDKNKSRVDVHVPLFFNMLNEKDGTSGKSKLDLSVMGGLVTVNRDKERDPNGVSTGPLVVTVFGIPVYSGVAASKPRVNPETSRNIMGQITDSVREANERSLSSLAETFSRIAASLNLNAAAKRGAETEQQRALLDQLAAAKVAQGN